MKAGGPAPYGAAACAPRRGDPAPRTGDPPLLTSAILARRLLRVAAFAAALAALPARGELRWTAVRVDADLLADGTVEVTENHVLLASGESFAATRWLDVRRPGVPELVEVVRVDREGRETKLEAGSLWEADRYEWDGTILRWSLRPGNAASWEAPTSLSYRLKWKLHGALTPVWGPRPEARPMPGRPLGERLAARWRETREALARAGERPLHRYVLDLNVAAPSREGPIEALDYGLTGDDAWAFGGDFMRVTLDRALPPDEGIDLSFLFDRRAGDRPAGVDGASPAALAGLALVPAAAGAFLLARTFLAWRRRRGKPAPAAALPDRPEELSPEVFAALFQPGPPGEPKLHEVWVRLRDEKVVVLDRQEPPNLVLRRDAAELRPPEAAFVRLLFGERGALPLAEARSTVAALGERLDEAVALAFDEEVLHRVGDAGPRTTEPNERSLDVSELVPTLVVALLIPFAQLHQPTSAKAAAIAGVLATAAVLFLATRKARNAGLGSGSGLVAAAGAVLVSVVFLAATYLHGGPPDVLRSVLLAVVALFVVRAGFVGARPAAQKSASPLRAWALEQREALRERLLRGGGEVEPAEAPWFRAAGLEVSLTEPGVSRDEFEELLGAFSALPPTDGSEG